ncbi:hypothetical protein KIN20_031939 [Parelaphostrongylus tenuis]|uniref:Uncharacterized protein n=1 Tax=Parelaphostrongylus tenuis TaxID=148309 RepID=A0AAD5WH52_PARTN|nr:hypothetical protein KIN20_031939 [Parelaphostrongylus tenuis]
MCKVIYVRTNESVSDLAVIADDRRMLREKKRQSLPIAQGVKVLPAKVLVKSHGICSGMLLWIKDLG